MKICSFLPEFHLSSFCHCIFDLNLHLEFFKNKKSQVLRQILSFSKKLSLDEIFDVLENFAIKFTKFNFHLCFRTSNREAINVCFEVWCDQGQKQTLAN